MKGNPLPPKKEVALALLERGSVHVHLDPRATGAIVPAWLKREPRLVLQVGLNMRPTPIPDLRVEDDRMTGTLSFNGSPFFCIVPWACVYAMVGDDSRGMIWPEDVPPGVTLQGRSPLRWLFSPSLSPFVFLLLLFLGIFAVARMRAAHTAESAAPSLEKAAEAAHEKPHH